MSQTPQPIFKDKLKNLSWIKIYSREYGVQYSEMAILCLGPKADFHVPSPSVNQIIIPEDNNTAFYIDGTSWKKLVESLNEEYTTHLNKLEKYEETFIKDGTKYLEVSKKTSKLNLPKASNDDLLNLYLDYQDKLFRYSIFAWTAFILNDYVAQRATSILDKYLKTHNIEDKKEEILETLFQPTKYAAILKLQHTIEEQKGNLSKGKFEKLYEEYKWLSCLDLHNEPWSKNQFREAVNAFKKHSLKGKKPFTHYATKLNITDKDLQYLLMAQRFVYIKDARDDFRRKGVYYALPFFAEIAKRMVLSTRDISYATSTEIINFLKSRTTVSQYSITARKIGFVMYLDLKNNIVCLQGESIRKALVEFGLANQATGIQQIKGTVASQGKASGLVAIVNGINDLSKVKEGFILVAVTTHPDYTIAMRKAAAIITNEGGITSHAAIVSRELGIPCIVGTQNATKLLKDGDKVEVDTIKGIVRRL